MDRLAAEEQAERLRAHLLDGLGNGRWPPGRRLPTERSLALEFGISRGGVRQVLADLEAEGRILRHVGRGTFAVDQSPAQPMADVMTDDRAVNPEDIMEARLLLEPALAALAVSRASERDLEEMQKLIRKGAAARTMAEFEKWDRRLHERIAAASKNDYLIGVLRAVHGLRGKPAWNRLHRRGLTMKRLATYQRQHAAIVEALTNRDPSAAEKATRAHLLTVRRNLLGF